MDVQMPNMDGLEAARIMLKLNRLPEAQRLSAMNANAMQENCQKYYETGMQDSMSKPVSVSDLETALSLVLKV